MACNRRQPVGSWLRVFGRSRGPLTQMQQDSRHVVGVTRRLEIASRRVWGSSILDQTASAERHQTPASARAPRLSGAITLRERVGWTYRLERKAQHVQTTRTRRSERTNYRCQCRKRSHSSKAPRECTSCTAPSVNATVGNASPGSLERIDTRAEAGGLQQVRQRPIKLSGSRRVKGFLLSPHGTRCGPSSPAKESTCPLNQLTPFL